MTWTSRLGKTYQVNPNPVITPLPDPVPPDSGDVHDLTQPDGPWNEHILQPEPEQTPEAPRPPPPTTVDDNEEPPF